MANLDLRPVESCQGRPEAHGEDETDLAIQTTSASNVRRNPSPSRLTGRDVSVEDFQGCVYPEMVLLLALVLPATVWGLYVLAVLFVIFAPIVRTGTFYWFTAALISSQSARSAVDDGSSRAVDCLQDGAQMNPSPLHPIQVEENRPVDGDNPSGVGLPGLAFLGSSSAPS